MKITGIDIGEYRQFKNIKFDFTYPADHKKAGQPLDKVCFIGQSGTGKTTLLDLLMLYYRSIVEAYDSARLERSQADIEGDFLYSDFSLNIGVTATIAAKSITLNEANGTGYELVKWFNTNELKELIANTDKLCLYIEDSIVTESTKVLQKDHSSLSQKDFVKLSSQVNEDESEESKELDNFNLRKIVRIGTSRQNIVWKYLLKQINDYDINLNRIALSMVTDINEFSANKLVEKINKWKNENINPRIELAHNCLNKILEKIFLEVDIDNSDAPITLKTKSGLGLKGYSLSNGTRQLIATAIPIYKFDTKGTVILFDEPERSLFPDIQRSLVKYYTDLAPEAQFFFATHSPIIASAFEPCERFILYFDENGEVKFHNGVAPEGDDPNDILRQDFAMAELMLQKGLEEYERYRQLAMQIRAETDEEKKNQLIVERLELGNRYNFAGQHA